MVKTKNKYGIWNKVVSKTLFHLLYALPRPNLYLASLFFYLITNTSIVQAQDIDFTLRYNITDNQYEVFGKSNNSYPNFFVGGGSQLSIILPESVPNTPLFINTVAGGIWTDNSQIFAPSATPLVDYHGIASNGSFMDFVFGEETLLFTFSIPNETCLDGIRLFDNANDPSSSEPSMNGGDFQNYFANALTFVNHYRANYNNMGTSCGTPSVFINPITTPINTGGQSCGTIININPNSSHSATLCQQSIHGTTTISINNATNQLCINYIPDTDFTGQDSVCVEICDENDICVQSMVLLNVFGSGNNNDTCANQSLPIIMGNNVICMGEQIELTTTDLGATYSYTWTNANNITIGQGATLNIASNNSLAVGPFKVTRTGVNCPPISSLPVDVAIIDFSVLTLENSGPICAGSSVELKANSLAGGTYTWFIAGTNTQVATGANPTINNLEITTTYRLEVSLNGCQNTNILETTVSVDPKPNISNLARTITVCRGEDVLISPTNEPATREEIRYIWTGPNDFRFKDNTTSNQFPLVLEDISPDQAGAYSIVISSANGCEVDSRSIIINVIDELEAPALIPVSNVVCSDNSIELTASLQDDANVQFEWFIQNEAADLFLLDITNVPSIIIENPTAANAGKYLVRIRKGDCISGFSNTEIITVLDETSNLAASNSTSITNQACEGDFVQLNVPFIAEATYNWFGPAGFTADTYNPFINPVSQLNAGDYFAVISIEGCTGIISAPTRVFINSQLTAPIISGNELFCEGEDLILEIMSGLIVDNDESPMVIWYNAVTNQAIDTINDNRLQIPQATAANSGQYFATISINGCESPPSNIIEVNIVSRTDLVANAGEDLKLCTAGAITLAALDVANTTGIWSSPTGAFIENPTTATTTTTNLIAGENLFIWSLENVCGQTAIDTLIINIVQTTGDIANAGNDQNICEEGTINLNATALEESTGLWTQDISQSNQGVLLINPNDPNTVVEGLTPGNVYQFTWTLSTNDCPNFMMDDVFIEVNEIPEEIAFIAEENTNIAVCEGTQARLIAETPLFSMGRWTTTSNATIVNPTLPETMVGDLPFGNQFFVWTLSNEACGDFSSDTVQVYRETAIEANPDAYSLSLEDSITFNILDNDRINDFENLTLTLTRFPEKGTLRDDGNGQFTFFSERTLFGEDNFRYKLCSNFCESVCDTAIVDLTILGSGAGNDCFIPNVLSPNGDNVNDQFLIGCLDQSPDASIKIFNRWGDIVHEAAPYKNDWEGTYKGGPLPAGTYFYSLKLTPESREIQDFITIFR